LQNKDITLRDFKCYLARCIYISF